MASPTFPVYDGDGVSVVPRRPGVDDVGGSAKEDNQKYPPNPLTMLAAADWNQVARLLVGFSRVLPVAVISVEITGGVPAISYFESVASNLVAGDITVTDNGAGDTSLTWTAGDFPVRNLNPAGLTLNEDAACDECMAIPIANGVQVITEDGGVGTDCNFTVYLHG